MCLSTTKSTIIFNLSFCLKITIAYMALCIFNKRVIGEFGGVAKKMWQVYIYSGGIICPVAGFKNFSGSLKSCQKVERVRSENSAGLGMAGVLLRAVPVAKAL